ncbi:Rieske (2Fe-2S) protein [Roseivirga seohaensis]|uniref:Rieske (2Fe-2S) protein n=1 Tax=Roseivirga seohaensis TaxID=1914963 RepID=UPI003BACE5BE
MTSYKLFDSKEELLQRLGDEGRKIIRIGDKKICLVLNQGEFHVFDHLCPHNQHSLLEGAINYKNEVVCPLHAYRFSLKDGMECEQRTKPLKIHSLKIENSGVFLQVND